MTPCIFPGTATEFTSQGDGPLSDSISCSVVEELNGQFELTMEYPIDGLNYDKIRNRSIICVSTDISGTRQPFRVYRTTKPLNGIVTVYARHICYDLSGIVDQPFTASSLTQALSAIKSYSTPTNSFTFTTDKSVSTTFSVKVPTKVFALLGGSQGSLLDVYGGEYQYNGFQVSLLSRRGADRGTVIRYGVNMTDMEQDENCANCYTAVIPYWSASEGDTVVTGSIVPVSGTFDYAKILPVDFSSEWESPPTVTDLNSRAARYITENKIGIPDVSWRVEFALLSQTAEYQDQRFLDAVYLGDTVSVYFDRLGVEASARAVAVDWDPLLERYNSVTLGKVKANLADTINTIQTAEKEQITTSQMAQAIAYATQMITGNLGGHVVLKSNSGGQPEEILIMDTTDITTATKVWRWNVSGLGYSGTGYAGPYTTAITADGHFVANFIDVGTLNGQILQADTVKAEALHLYGDMEVWRDNVTAFLGGHIGYISGSSGIGIPTDGIGVMHSDTTGQVKASNAGAGINYGQHSSVYAVQNGVGVNINGTAVAWIDGDAIRPYVNNGLDLGTSALYYGNAYVSNLYRKVGSNSVAQPPVVTYIGTLSSTAWTDIPFTVTVPYSARVIAMPTPYDYDSTPTQTVKVRFNTAADKWQWCFAGTGVVTAQRVSVVAFI